MNNEEFRQLFRSLGITMECPRCGKHYDLSDITLRSQAGNTYRLKLNCNYCHTPVSATVAISGDFGRIAEKFALLPQVHKKPIDITKSSISSKKKKGKITNDDVIDIHQFLSDFDGDFENTFKE
jgi:hypothetical protein